jgi:YHS domain-containing protein
MTDGLINTGSYVKNKNTERKNLFIKIIFLYFTIIITLFFISCSSALPPVNVDSNGIAIKGYDAVAYRSKDKAIKGKAIYAFEWNGAKWHFSSEEHMKLFVDFPDHYAPQYGGYCAYAVSQGKTADIDPEAWSIVNNKLYLNLDKDVKRLWGKELQKNIASADNNWPGVLEK